MPLPSVAALLSRLMPRRDPARATAGLWAALRTLEAESAQPHHADDWNDTALWHPKARAALAAVRRAGRHGADLYAPGAIDEGATPEPPMVWALTRQRWHVAQALLDAGIDPNREDAAALWHRGKSDPQAGFEQVRQNVPYTAHAMIALMEKANRPNGLIPDSAWGVLDSMAENGGTFDWADATGSSLGLQVVAAWSRPENLPNVWWTRLNPNRCDQWGRNMLHYWPYATDHSSLFPRLIDLGADPYRNDHQGQTPLLRLAKISPAHAREDVIQRLIKTHDHLLWHAATGSGESPLNVLDATPPNARSVSFDALVRKLREQAIASEKDLLASAMDESLAATRTVEDGAVPTTGMPSLVQPPSRGRARL